MDAIISLLLMIALPCLLVVMMLTYLTNGELWRPFIGYMLFRKPKIAHDYDTVLLFKIGNHGRDVLTHQSLNYSQRRLETYVNKNSWFKRKDMSALMHHYILMYDAVTAYQNKLRRNTRAPQNKPISEWRKILGVDAHCSDPKTIKSRFRALVAVDHPDKGGTGARMPELTRALDTARNELGFV